VRLAIAVVAFGVTYSLTGILRHRDFGSSVDLAIFNQGIWLLSRFEVPISSIKGYNIFGDHFHPVIGVFVPFYWLAPGPETLIVVQGLFFAVSIVPVYLFLRRRFEATPAFLLAIGYGLFWGLQRAALFDVHEFAFAPLLVATAIVALDTRRLALLWVTCLLLMLTKEDLIPLVTGIGGYLFIMGDRRQGTALAAVSLAALVLVLKILIPYMSGLGHYGYTNTYDEALHKPWLIPALIATPEKMRTVGLWLAPFLLLPLRSPLVLLLVPLALERFLSGTASHWGTSFHYSAPLAPILAMSAGDGLARLLPRVSSERRARLALGMSSAIVILSAILPGRQPVWRLFAFDRYIPGKVESSAPEAFRAIPPDASVAAPAAIAAHLSMRHQIVLIEAGSRPATEFIVVHRDVNPWPLEHFDALQAVIDDRRANGYESTYEQDGWTILRRTR
jgi:uncharacterized membrane protein